MHDITANLHMSEKKETEMDIANTLLDATTRSEIIEILLSKLRENYVFPNVAEEMEESMRRRLSGGEYNDITTGEAFAETLTVHLQEISKDKHLQVFYSSAQEPAKKDVATPSETYRNSLWLLKNYGFEKVERLPGNIGYLDFRAFYPVELAGEVAIAALNFLANTTALIVDLRKNHGGEPALVALMCSYFFDSEPVHLNSIYWRASNRTQQFWTLPYVPGRRYLNKPVYVLTSHETFSGAEEFTYNLKSLKRATIIGEITGGGAHPGDIYTINAHFTIFIPTGRAINPITGSNWEGTGVIPDIEVLQEEALKVAHVMALKKVLEDIGDMPTQAQEFFVQELQETLARLERANHEA